MLVSIGNFSKVTRLSIKALRLYDQLGLLRPAVVDSSTRYRRYHIGQARRAELIRMLRAADMPPESIRRLLESEDDAAAIDRELERHRQHLRNRLEAQIRERELEPARVAEILHRGPPDLIGPAFRRVMEWVFENGWQVSGPTREIYESDPSCVPAEERVTRLQVPIAKRSR